MPRWTIHSSVGSISAAEKDSIAKQVTTLYTDLGLPAFFINVFFHEHEIGNYYCGGESEHSSVFFHIDHAARNFESEHIRSAFISRVKSIVEPILGTKKRKWEFNIYEHPRDNWRINGMIPPIDHPDLLKEWVEKDDAVWWDGAGTTAKDDASLLRDWAAVREKESFMKSSQE